MRRSLFSAVAFAAAAALLASAVPARAQSRSPADLDQRVQAFLDRHRGTWHDLNVPEIDGRTLHDLIVQHKFTKALEIGTSTGHSAIWIAWALSKTGGRLTTIEIDPHRHRQALTNFREAGLDRYIDAKRADAHTLVTVLPAGYDFVFSDADKEWYSRYFDAIWPKMASPGCFAAHNVLDKMAGIAQFLDRVRSVPDGTTTFDRKSPAGLSITCKRQ
jgi:predicted O-methyltransferase YrrM